MSLLVRLLVLALLTAWTALAGAQEDQAADVDVSFANDSSPWTGQPVTVHLDLKTPALSFSDVFFNLPDVTDALVLRTDSTTVKLTERRGSETWQVLRYPITVFPQRPGRLDLPSFEVRFQTQNGFGSPSVAHRIDTGPLTITVRQPPGVPDGSVLVTTRDLDVSYDWALPETPAMPGAAITLTVTRQADGVSAMLLPPVPVYEADGLSAYPGTPNIDDRTNRGRLTGIREDRITWIVERGGAYTFPAIEFRSWNPVAERLEVSRVESVSLSVETPPGAEAPASGESRPASSPIEFGRWSFAGLGAFLALFFAWRFRAPIVASWASVRVRILPPARALLRSLNPGASS